MSEPLLESLTRFIIKALNGERPAMFAELFLSARLLPFKKKDDGVRPFAVGEVLPRLGAKVALHQIMPVIQEKMPPLQLGVAVSIRFRGAPYACGSMCASTLFGKFIGGDITSRHFKCFQHNSKASHS